MEQRVHTHPRAAEWGSFAPVITEENDWAEVGNWSVPLLAVKAFAFEAEDEDLQVQILGSLDGGETFDLVAVPAFTVSAAAEAPERVQIADYYTDLQVQVQPATEDQHGTLSTKFAGAAVPIVAQTTDSGGEGG